ncbi:unnamed protein product [Strongylus vulgaris]|uniref:Uncharacterized protein n=1 Tax=Strongylus vulgaris TaxID=40348 RepID=A0A3P7JP78_STRVU|nr:unnamed protein product [Strongylus vulgaris]
MRRDKRVGCFILGTWPVPHAKRQLANNSVDWTRTTNYRAGAEPSRALPREGISTQLKHAPCGWAAAAERATIIRGSQ